MINKWIVDAYEGLSTMDDYAAFLLTLILIFFCAGLLVNGIELVILEELKSRREVNDLIEVREMMRESWWIDLSIHVHY